MRGEREAVERSEEGVREEGGSERQEGREGGNFFSIVYLFANQVRNTLAQNMGGEEDSKGGNSARLCARYLSSSLSLPCSLVLPNRYLYPSLGGD